MLIPELTPDFSRVGPENQDFYHIPHVILHSGNFEDSWTLNWNGGQEVGKKEKESRENSWEITGKRKNQMKSYAGPFTPT